MNEKQKYILVIGIILIVAALIYWLTQGAEILTKTQVLVDKSTELDRMLGVKNEQYVNKFILGLDYSGGLSALVAIITGIFIYLFRNKKKEQQ